MREHSAKKKKGLRDLKSRISLPPELKNSFSFTKPHPSTTTTTNNQSSGMNASMKFKSNHQVLQQRSSYYQTNSLSTQTLNNVLHQSNTSLLRLSPSQLNTSLSGQLSRNEQRLSMLDLGFGKIESYVKLEKLGEGNSCCSSEKIFILFVLGTYATVYKGKSHLLNGYIALKEIRLEQEEGTLILSQESQADFYDLFYRINERYSESIDSHVTLPFDPLLYPNISYDMKNHLSCPLGAPCTALREVSLLKGLKHNNIVSLHDIIFNQTTLTLVFEFVEKDLKQYMDDCGNLLHIKNVRLFLFQLLRGLDYCHSRKILHRDLK